MGFYRNIQNRTKRNKTMGNRQVETAIYIIGWIAIAVVGFYYLIVACTDFSLEKIGIPCTFHLLTGYYCPGCGGTRAVKALLAGRIWQSFCYHPIVLLVTLWGIWFMISQTVERVSHGKLRIGMRYRDLYLWLMLGIILLNCTVKNIMLFLGR